MKTLFYPLMGMLLLIGCGKGVTDSSLPNTRPDEEEGLVADYFPLQEGLRWTYEDRATTIQVMGSNPTIYGPAYRVAGLMQDRVLRQTWDGKIMELQGDTWRLLFDLSAGVQTTWTIEGPEESVDLLDGATVKVESRSDAVVTPFGRFSNAIRLSVQPRDGLFDAGVSQMWFAPGVGLVKWSETWIGGERVHTLTGFGAADRELTTSD